jgi:hypothetical protein
MLPGPPESAGQRETLWGQKGDDMKRRTWLVLLVCVAGLAVTGGSAQAEPPGGMIPCEGAEGAEGTNSCPPPPPPPPPPGTPDYAPYGWHGDITPDGYILGWACDPNDFNYPIFVHFYADNGRGWHGYMGQTQAGGWWNEGVAGACGGNPWHGYSFRIPDWIRNGEGYQLYSYAINICGSYCEQGNPRQSGAGAIFGFGYPAGWNDNNPISWSGESDWNFFGTDAACGPNSAWIYSKTFTRGQGPGVWNRKLKMRVVWCANGARTKIIGYKVSLWTEHGAWCGSTSAPTYNVEYGGIGWSFMDIRASVEVNCASVPFNWPRRTDTLWMLMRLRADRSYQTLGVDS